jgi:tRNA A-37 threonylcarbamoyl transferase component Bud32
LPVSVQNDEISRDDPRLNKILAEYLQAVESDESPDQESLLQEYPEYASELRTFFAAKGQVDEIVQAAANDRQASSGTEMPTLPPEQTAIDAPTMDSVGTPNVAPAPGTTVRYFGDYELLEEIARGGMGVVYKARQINLNRVVALKMILAGQLASEDDVKRFYTEAEAAANLDHPGIVPIFEVGEHEGQHYFSMGFVEGESLADRLKDGPLPPREAAEHTRKVAEAIAFAHEHGVIHRDLKPANILLDQGDQPKVTDFGLAKKTEGDSNLTGTGQILGTPSYMPPQTSIRWGRFCTP